MRRWLVAGVGGLMVLLGLLLIVRADDGLSRDRVVVDGLPVSVLRPAAEGPYPAVVVAHGFSGSSRLMDGIGIALARDGWLVAMPDLPGHGTNSSSLDDADLAADVLAVADWLSGRDDVGEVALLGHSMGAGAVTEAATQQPALPVVAVSLPSAQDLSDNLDALFLVGSAEPARFAEAAAQAAERGYRTVTISGAEHISILFRTQTLQTAVAWLDAAVDRPAGQVASDWRMLGVGLAYLGSAVLFWPLSGWLVPTRPGLVRERGSRVPVWVAVPVAGLVAGGFLALLPQLGELVPLLVGGYLAAFFALTGLGLWVLCRRGERVPVRSLVGPLLMGVYAAASIGVPAALAWAQVSLAGPRGWSMLALVSAVALYAWAEGLLAGRPGYTSLLVGRVLLTAVLAGLAATGTAPGFLVLLVPLVAVVLPWFGAYGVRVARLSGSPLAAALVQAPPLALLVAITTPLA